MAMHNHGLEIGNMVTGDWSSPMMFALDALWALMHGNGWTSTNEE